jgi:hypothetical protein
MELTSQVRGQKGPIVIAYALKKNCTIQEDPNPKMILFISHKIQ